MSCPMRYCLEELCDPICHRVVVAIYRKTKTGEFDDHTVDRAPIHRFAIAADMSSASCVGDIRARRADSRDVLRAQRGRCE